MMQVATLGGGCFWCLEAVYDTLAGVDHVESGFAGGAVVNPTYQHVCTGATGHAEVVQVTFDPDTISYDEILDVFFSVHDPTTLNRQGADVGTQYRSVIFYHDEAQKATAQQKIQALNQSGEWSDPIVTEVVPFEVVYEAEDYHQEYFANNKFQPYCMAVIAPKMRKFKKKFSAFLG